jgi:hypothetical protein
MMASGEIRLSGTTTRQMPVLAQSDGVTGDISTGFTVTANSQQGGFGSDPGFAGSSINQISDIEVDGTRLASSSDQGGNFVQTASQITTPLGFSFNDARYMHIKMRHILFKYPYTSWFYPMYSSKAALGLLINLVLAAGPGMTQPNGNINWTYNLGIPLGTDASTLTGVESTWLTLIVNPNAPGGPTVWTMYPAASTGP